jgi:hypothetical protein
VKTEAPTKHISSTDLFSHTFVESIKLLNCSENTISRRNKFSAFFASNFLPFQLWKAVASTYLLDVNSGKHASWTDFQNKYYVIRLTLSCVIHCFNSRICYANFTQVPRITIIDSYLNSSMHFYRRHFVPVLNRITVQRTEWKNYYTNFLICSYQLRQGAIFKC